jgi:hypothetical protein
MDKELKNLIDRIETISKLYITSSDKVEMIFVAVRQVKERLLTKDKTTKKERRKKWINSKVEK